MKWYSKYKHPDGLRLEIKDGGNVGFYGIVYDVAKNKTYDYLQDDLDTVKQFLFKKFQVPEDSWVEADEEFSK